jgi:hypothetical protein
MWPSRKWGHIPGGIDEIQQSASGDDKLPIVARTGDIEYAGDGPPVLPGWTRRGHRRGTHKDQR